MKNIAAVFSILVSCSAFAATHQTEIRGKNLLRDETLQVKLEDSKALVVVFLSAKCPCSDSHLAELRALHKDFPQMRFVAVHSNADESPELALPYFQKAQLPFDLIQDEGNRWADEFKALKTPHAFVVSSQGEILYQGGVTDSKNLERAQRKFLREALTDLMADRKVQTPEGRTLGCVISRGKNVW